MKKLTPSLNLENKPRPLIHADVPVYLHLLREKYQLTTGVAGLWDDLERLLLCVQRHMLKTHPDNAHGIGLASDEIINTLQLFAEQGKLDLAYIKSLPQPPPK